MQGLEVTWRNLQVRRISRALSFGLPSSCPAQKSPWQCCWVAISTISVHRRFKQPEVSGWNGRNGEKPRNISEFKKSLCLSPPSSSPICALYQALSLHDDETHCRQNAQYPWRVAMPLSCAVREQGNTPLTNSPGREHSVDQIDGKTQYEWKNQTAKWKMKRKWHKLQCGNVIHSNKLNYHVIHYYSDVCALKEPYHIHRLGEIGTSYRTCIQHTCNQTTCKIDLGFFLSSIVFLPSVFNGFYCCCWCFFDFPEFVFLALVWFFLGLCWFLALIFLLQVSIVSIDLYVFGHFYRCCCWWFFAIHCNCFLRFVPRFIGSCFCWFVHRL